MCTVSPVAAARGMHKDRKYKAMRKKKKKKNDILKRILNSRIK